MTIEEFCKHPSKEAWNKLDSTTRRVIGDIVTLIYKNDSVYNRSYKGLVKIMYNLVRNRVPVLVENNKEVYGIIDWHYLYSEKYNMKVYLLSDNHMLNYACNGTAVSIVDVIIEQIDCAPCFVDLYIEIPYTETQHKTSRIGIHNYMDSVYQTLGDCLQINKTNCVYPNLRAHYVDTRSKKEYISLRKLIDVLARFYPLYYCEETYYYIYTYINEIETLLDDKQLRNILKSKDTLDDFILKQFKPTKMKKQLDNIPDKHVYQAINMYIKTAMVNRFKNHPNKYLFDYKVIIRELIKVKDLLVKVMSSKPKHIAKTNSVLKNVIDQETRNTINSIMMPLYNTLMVYTSIIMDIYTIARMFRSYRPVKNQYSGVAKNLIVYAGGSHTINYELFLRTFLGFKTVNSQRNSLINNCISLNGMPIQWFT